MDPVQAEPMKRCPFCGEQVLAVAIKCKHCGSMLDQQAPSSATPPPAAEPATATAQEELKGVILQATAGMLSEPRQFFAVAWSVALGTMPFSIGLLDWVFYDRDLRVMDLFVGVFTGASLSLIFGGVAGVILRGAYSHLARSKKVLPGAAGIGAVYAMVLFYLHQGVLRSAIGYYSFPTGLTLALSVLGAASGMLLGVRAARGPEAARMADQERFPSSAIATWQSLLVSLLLLGVAPIPALNAERLDRGSIFWASMLSQMSDVDSALVHPSAVKIVRGGLRSDDKELIEELERKSPKERFQFCMTTAACGVLGPFNWEIPMVLTRVDVVTVFRGASDREEQNDIRIGMSYLLCVVSLASAILCLRRRPWLQGDVSIARSARSGVAFRMGLVAVSMALVATGWATYLAVASKLPGIVAIGIGAGGASLAWVASRFFGDANRLRTPASTGTP